MARPRPLSMVSRLPWFAVRFLACSGLTQSVLKVAPPTPPRWANGVGWVNLAAAMTNKRPELGQRQPMPVLTVDG
jgi:hypothetical protein